MIILTEGMSEEEEKRRGRRTPTHTTPPPTPTPTRLLVLRELPEVTVTRKTLRTGAEGRRRKESRGWRMWSRGGASESHAGSNEED